MNKRLFVLICSIILFQYIYNSDCTDATTETEKSVCNGKAVDDSTNICVLKTGGGCEEKAKGDVPCEDVEAGASDALCKGLKVTDDTYLCLKEGDACKQKKKCKEGKGNDDATCKTFAVETAGNVCKNDPDEKDKCKEVKDESATSSSYSLKFSLALLIFLFVF